MTPIRFLTALAALALLGSLPLAAAEGGQDDAKPYPLDTCLVSGEDLESMGGAYTIVHQGQTVKFCCKSCVRKFNKDPEGYLAKMRERAAAAGDGAGAGKGKGKGKGKGGDHGHDHGAAGHDHAGQGHRHGGEHGEHAHDHAGHAHQDGAKAHDHAGHAHDHGDHDHGDHGHGDHGHHGEHPEVPAGRLEEAGAEDKE